MVIPSEARNPGKIYPIPSTANSPPPNPASPPRLLALFSDLCSFLPRLPLFHNISRILWDN